MCGVLDVGIGGYRAWTRGGQPDRQRLTDRRLPALIWAIHAELKNAHGAAPECSGICVPEASLPARNGWSD
jgi:hypothetical protein